MTTRTWDRELVMQDLTDRYILPVKKIHEADDLPGIIIEDEEPLRFDFRTDDGKQGYILVRAPLPRPSWLVFVVDKLARMLELPPNWNSYGAQPIEANAVEGAFTLLASVATSNTPPPAVLPTSRRGVQFEWHTESADLEIEVSADGRVYALYENVKHNSEWEGEVSNDLSRLRKVVAEVSAPSH